MHILGGSCSKLSIQHQSSLHSKCQRADISDTQAFVVSSLSFPGGLRLSNMPINDHNSSMFGVSSSRCYSVPTSPSEYSVISNEHHDCSTRPAASSKNVRTTRRRLLMIKCITSGCIKERTHCITANHRLTWQACRRH